MSDYKEMIRKDQLDEISGYAGKYYEGINRTFNEYDISNILRQTSFLSQIAHESGGFKWNKELWGPTEAQKRYEGRTDLGNTEPGDGFRFRGRGLIQLTGRYNYEQFSKEFEVDFVENPEWVAEDPWAVLVAGWYWDKHNINEPADRQAHKEVTRKINGGLNGFEDRMKWYKKIWDILYEM